ncbi:hypothetical protein KL921_002447 [Ogataea angusta]|uniref:Uncharacterized protein n=1 Tax=Pichia angusta TaxID=870730 RepID=A0AAN6I6C7_PICAN|nr:uncharacterized protein KL928_001839 [Ogataea angusta]KAG7810819.1 hypothetical protein KL921_002447 [Ogataea angusta]KAG7819301.1 hypothetical protein KL909_004889 [Ogataea angusta]KAG7820402.1 hypothetical protein KL928_001839 [Ogataea angusta]KAG7838639.1 hypothetical protein KL943_000715 [Ogataea angusta]KAG7860939.1 hypothetical protein KL939_001506 [Ogataea angusta]
MSLDLATVSGWLYAIAWSVSFYPTILLNLRIRSADSISLDFAILNLLGYSCYTASIYLQVFSETVRKQFSGAFGGNLPLLSVIDLAYSVHGWILTVVLLSQIILGNQWWGLKNTRTSFKFSKLVKGYYVAFGLFLLYNIYYKNQKNQLLNFTLNLSYCKILVSCTKYIPQVLHNAKRRSMFGISKMQILLDLSGCFFSIAELLLRNKTTLLKLLEANRSKLGLIFVTMVFDLIFLAQFHLYKPPRKQKPNMMEKIPV